MADKPEDKRVGFKHPPVHSRFQPGQSGNPSGRPKQRPSFQADLIAALNEVTRVRDGGREVEITKQRAVANAIVAAAIAADVRAVAFCARAVGATNGDDNADSLAADEFEVLKDYVTRESKRRAAAEGREKASPTGSSTKETSSDES